MNWAFIGMLFVLGVFMTFIGKKDAEKALDGIETGQRNPFGELPAGIIMICLAVAAAMVKVLVPPRVTTPEPVEGCRSELAHKICVVKPPTVEKDRYRTDRVCEKDVDTTTFLRQLTTSYDAYPEFVQKQLCSLSKIYLETEFFGNAWSDAGVIAINKALSDADPSASDALSGFDQLTFGGPKPGFSPTLSSPMIKVTPTMSMVTHTLLHELAHTFDYQYDFQTKAWKKLWSADFPLQKKVCLNNCRNGFIPLEQASELYQELSDHGLISQLAAVSAQEDFAELFAYMIEHLSMDSKRVLQIDGVESEPLERNTRLGTKKNTMAWILTWLGHGAKGELK